MVDLLDLDKHRQTLTERLSTLSKELEHTSAGSKALYEFTTLLHQVLDNVEQRVILQQAESTLFQKLVLGGVRLSKNWEEYQKMCLGLEEKLGYFKSK